MTTRVGFLGAGLIATFHSKVLRRSGEDATWAGVHDPDRARAEAFAAASGGFACETEEQVLDSCDAVYICTWTSEHRRLVDAACERGLAVFCEKPLSTSLADARAMGDAVGRAGVVNQVGLILRRSPAFHLVRRLVDDERSGRLMSVVFRDDQFIPVQGTYRSTWRGDVEKAGAGTLLEHSIHDVDMLEYVAGPLASVSGRSASFHGLEGIEDVMAVSLGFASGAVGSLVSVWHDVLERPSLRRVELFCERLWVAIEGEWLGPVRWVRTGEAEQVLEGSALIDAIKDDGDAATEPSRMPDAAFVRAVRDGAPAWPDFAVALRAHEVVDAVYRSAAIGGGAIDIEGVA